VSQIIAHVIELTCPSFSVQNLGSMSEGTKHAKKPRRRKRYKIVILIHISISFEVNNSLTALFFCFCFCFVCVFFLFLFFFVCVVLFAAYPSGWISCGADSLADSPCLVLHVAIFFWTTTPPNKYALLTYSIAGYSTASISVLSSCIFVSCTYI
jgi:hypothetical protein